MRVRTACAALAMVAAAYVPGAWAQSWPSSQVPKEAAGESAGRVCDSLLGLLMKFFPDSVKQTRIAVYPVLNTTGDKALTGGTWVSEYLVRQLRKSGRFAVVDRTAYRRGLRNHDMGPKDVVDDSTAQLLSAALGAPYLFTGDIAPSRSGNYKLEGRIVDAQSGIIVTGADIEVSAAELERLEGELIAQRMKTAITPAAVRSMVLPGWGQFYRKRPVFGTLFLVAYLGGVGGGTYLGVRFYEARKDFTDFQNYFDYSKDYLDDEKRYVQSHPELAPLDAKAAFRKEQEQKGNRLGDEKDKQFASFGISAGVVACIYALDLLDVVIAGRRMAHEYRLYFTGDFTDEAGIVVSLEF